MKTDNISEVGTHVFERAGLGRAPFRCVGVYEKSFRAHPSAPAQPGGCCDYCGTGIVIHCQIQSADAKSFVVGIDCVRKTEDEGLLKAYLSLPEVRAKAKTARDAKAARDLAELTRLIQEQQGHLVLLPHPTRRPGCTLLDYARWMLAHAGAKGRGETLRSVKKALAQADNLDAGAGALKLAEIERQRTAVAQQRDEAERSRQRAEDARKALLAPLAARLADGRNGFRDSVAGELRRGMIPGDRASRILCDILAQHAGRTNSKDYNSEWSRVSDLLDEAQALR